MFNEWIARSLSLIPKPIVHAVANRYVAGNTLDHAVETVKSLNSKGIHGTIDFLGEFVSDRARATEATEMSAKILDSIRTHQLDAGLSVKLTSLGLDIDDDFCFSNVKSLVNQAKSIGRFVRLDMENSPYTTRTLQIYRRLRDEGHDSCGVVIQAYMRRSEEDLRALAALQPAVRLCKGIYRESSAIAFQGYEEVRENYKRLLVLLFELGMKPAIATHDDALLDFARDYISRNQIQSDRYEFQMLLGVREAKRDELVREGHPMRIYVPFGEDWYGYSIRRLKENPQIAGHIFRALLGMDH